MMGTVPEWISVLVAAAALIAAVWAGLTSKRLFDVERKRDEVALDRREKEQASEIAAWSVTYDTPADQPSPKGLLIHNSSNAPVFDVKVLSTYSKTKRDTPETQKPLTMSVLTPGDYAAIEDDKFPWKFPETQSRVEEKVHSRLRPVTNNPGWMVTGIAFVDSYGTSWLRDERGQLLRLEKEETP
ncbi:hypothetical protein VVR84_15245 [Kocuria carniphila]|uniref:Uncharacterized protein n=1 Tax=Kocuria carniphila TaxID=262208 RepID=A0ABV3V5K8_9MICC|nr:hypothetical protein [Kocuria carniphila]MCT1803870.1 hypothetical protein [Kocuria carniphila]PZP35281.1 MAG: hypothetical protein DI613_04885 [Kocuria rhizophila]